jgi:hypothetical protein
MKPTFAACAGQFFDQQRCGDNRGVAAILDGTVGKGHRQMHLAAIESSALNFSPIQAILRHRFG